MHKAGDLCQLQEARFIVQRFQNVTSCLRSFCHMGEGMLREAESNQRFISPFDIGPDLRIILYGCKRYKGHGENLLVGILRSLFRLL